MRSITALVFVMLATAASAEEKLTISDPDVLFPDSKLIKFYNPEIRSIRDYQKNTDGVSFFYLTNLTFEKAKATLETKLGASWRPIEIPEKESSGVDQFAKQSGATIKRARYCNGPYTADLILFVHPPSPNLPAPEYQNNLFLTFYSPSAPPPK